MKDWVTADQDSVVGTSKTACGGQVLRRSEAGGFRGQLLRWTVAAFLGSLVPVLLVLTTVLIPGAIETKVEHSLLPFAFCKPLRGGPYAMVFATAVLFCGVGLTLSAVRFPTMDGPQDVASHILLLMAIGGCLFVVPLLSVVWTLSITNGYASLTVLLTHAGNHGPWRRVCHLRELLQNSLLVPWVACGLGRFAFAVKSSREAMLVSIASIIVFLALIASHYWLID